ncbi:hypothetical protein HXX76_014062 [Chlamydomonas incerta]|uniref:dUTP diphosphatase n=1 Tax=Chlamydomonas incerta TaxID=51695 RepID=A0A835VTG4_CHLIN|nr:hypothetical protein HXX76_014062 [Chlamydomonas incerta]|eukprot:KAG2424904.1 hypothetical protein HXX76_014062 [Chlamydomonas incerta]
MASLGPANCTYLPMDGARFQDPRQKPPILSQPAHSYRFLKIMSNGSCAESTFDNLTGYRYGADVSVDRYLLSARDQAMPTLRGLLGASQADRLVAGAEDEQLDKLVRLFNTDPVAANALRVAGQSIELVKPTRVDAVTYEVDGAAVSGCVAADRGISPDPSAAPVGLIRSDTLLVYATILDTIRGRLALAPGTPDSGPLLIYSDRLISLLRQPSSGRLWFELEICAYRAYKPHGFHLLVHAEHDPALNMASIVQSRFIGDVMSDSVVAAPVAAPVGAAMDMRGGLAYSSAVIPSKGHPTDSGFDLTLISKLSQKGHVCMYETGISLAPPPGFYMDLVPRSSIVKSGYMLANSVGVIDASYRGTIKVPLIKVDPDAPDLELPVRLVQLIPRRVHEMEVVVQIDLTETERGDGGFGSTGRV